MKKNLLLACLLFLVNMPSYAVMENPYGIYYTQVYKNGVYKMNIVDVTRKSVAQKAGVKVGNTIDNINNNTNLNMKNTKMYFDSSQVKLDILDEDSNIKTYNLKAKNIKTIDKSLKKENKINTYIQKEKYKTALKRVNSYIKKYPNDVTLKSDKIKVLLLLHQYGEAINELTQLYKITNSPEVLGTLSSVYITTGDYESAKKYAEQALEMRADEITANATMVIYYTDTQQYKNALKYANNLVTYAPKMQTSYHYRGLVNKNLGNLRNSYSDLEKAYKLSKQYKDKNIFLVVSEMLDVNKKLIDVSVSNVNSFIELPDWFEICPTEYVYSNGKKAKWNDYWNVRRENYLASINSCMHKYSGQNLYKCYASVRNKEFRLNDDYKIVREHTWQQEKREEIYGYAKDLLTLSILGAMAIKSTPEHKYIHYSGNINQNVNFTGTLDTYNRYYFQ